MNNISDKYFEKILFNQEEIENKIKELALWVNKTYENSNDLILVGLLKGSIPFIAQLMKGITVNHILDFMTVSTYNGGVNSTGNLKIIMDLKQDISNKDVLIVEDIVDSGLTLTKVIEILKNHQPKSIKVITLLDKPEGRKIDFKPDKYGFIVPNVFLAGFGLDVNEKLRNLPYIGIFNKKNIGEL